MRSLEKLSAQRQMVRKQRQRQQAVVIALVGYTNAGKSALLQTLTNCPDTGVVPLSEDRLFHTLDCTARSLDLPHGMSAVLLDTVGFVSELPHQLVESFKSTLQDVTSADIIVHVRDCCHPETDIQKAEVLRVLNNDMKMSPALLDAMIEVHNKCDMLCDEVREDLRQSTASEGGLLVSATQGAGLEDLRQLLTTQVLRVLGKVRTTQKSAARHVVLRARLTNLGSVPVCSDVRAGWKNCGF